MKNVQYSSNSYFHKKYKIVPSGTKKIMFCRIMRHQIKKLHKICVKFLSILNYLKLYDIKKENIFDLFKKFIIINFSSFIILHLDNVRKTLQDKFSSNRDSNLRYNHIKQTPWFITNNIFIDSHELCTRCNNI